MDEREMGHMRKLGTAAAVAVTALVGLAAPAGAHAGNGDSGVTHACVADGVYRLVGADPSATCRAGEEAVHLVSTPITGPQPATGSSSGSPVAGESGAQGEQGLQG
ncbi:MAG TPA: hypothetical protein VEA78_06900, partial [Acidimicrobiales bacterium]|nr:hypothetical protein [Acidimicrobiales bacterium]